MDHDDETCWWVFSSTAAAVFILSTPPTSQSLSLSLYCQWPPKEQVFGDDDDGVVVEKFTLGICMLISGSEEDEDDDAVELRRSALNVIDIF